jgi:hypothetical protein
MRALDTVLLLRDIALRNFFFLSLAEVTPKIKIIGLFPTERWSIPIGQYRPVNVDKITEIVEI